MRLAFLSKSFRRSPPGPPPASPTRAQRARGHHDRDIHPRGRRAQGRHEPRFRRPRLAGLFLLLFGLLSPATDAFAATRTLLVLGDSISAAYGMARDVGWVSLLRQRLAAEHPDWQVVDASVSGETTAGGRARLPDALATHAPELVIIELGGNDGLRGYPLPTIRDNLVAMIGDARTAGARVLLLGMQIPPNYGPRYTRGFAELFATVAQETGVALLPFLLERVAIDPALMQADGIHPTAAAQPLLLETVWPALEPLLTAAPQSETAAAAASTTDAATGPSSHAFADRY